MRYFRYILVSLLFFNFLFSQEKPQRDRIEVETRYGFSVTRLPQLNFGIYADYDPVNWTPILYLGVAIQNDILQFKKTGDEYQAEYRISVAIREEDNAVIKQNWTRSIVVNSFDETNSRNKFHYSSFKFSEDNKTLGSMLKAGTYNCLFEIRDLNSKKAYQSERMIDIQPALEMTEQQILSSGLAFLIDEPDSTGPYKLHPGGAILRFNQPYLTYFRLRAPQQKSLDVNMRLYQMTDQEDKLFQQEFLTYKVDSLSAQVLYTLPMNKLPEGRYKIRFTAEVGGEEFIKENEFSVTWFLKPTYLYKADLALRPLKYIMSPEEFEEANDLSYRKLEKWLQEFWKAKDPTPDTEYNELVAEFYQRVSEANRKFSTRYIEGWETDRGKVYTTYGKPDEIENKRYATSTKPYIIWKYKATDAEFIFVDVNSTGEFTLLTEGNED